MSRQDFLVETRPRESGGCARETQAANSLSVLNSTSMQRIEPCQQNITNRIVELRVPAMP